MDRLLATLSMLLPAAADVPVPEWVQLVPAGEFRGRDGRGPWRLRDPEAVLLASQRALPLPVDETHATDLGAPVGQPAPARGWVEELELRDGSLWGRVRWTPTGTQLLAERAYRGLSPAIVTDRAGNVLEVVRASLTNLPNLSQLATLNSQDILHMDLLAQLRQLHGLAADADAAAVLAACTASHGAAAQRQTDLNSLATAAGLPPGADASAIGAALRARPTPAAVTQLEGTVVQLQTQLATLQGERARERAVAAVDGAIRAGKPVAALRDRLIERHMTDPAGVQVELDALPSLNSGGIVVPPSQDGTAAPTGDEAQILALLGVDPKAYAAERKRLGLSEERA